MPDAQLHKADVFDQLVAGRRPYLIGVRHHSPACAARMDEWLCGFNPEVILLELPPDFESWLPWLAHPETKAPVALAGSDHSDALFFYPFADFSPELAALRWGARHKVPVIPFDLQAGQRSFGTSRRLPGGSLDLLEGLMRTVGVEDFDDLWDEKVEAPAPASSAEAVRKAGLLVGWAQRLQEAADPGIRERDLARETAMRKVLEGRSEERIAAVLGSFHAAALLESPVLWEPVTLQAAGGPVRTSLVPYTFELLDSRSGYPAGIRDPRWQQEVLESSTDPDELRERVIGLAVEICRDLRTRRHPAGTPDAAECARMALELAAMRGLVVPGRREFLEAVQTSMAQGELLGRGRALAKSLQSVLVGKRRGALAPGTPRSGLGPHVEELLEALRLPRGPEQIRLDPLRSPLDRSRHVALCRLECCGVPYAQHRDSGDTLTQVWSLEWTPASSAGVEMAAFRGVTLAQACGGMLLDPERPLLDRLLRAAECALPELVSQLLLELGNDFLNTAGLQEMLRAMNLLDRLRLGQIPGLPPEDGGTPPLPIKAFPWGSEVLRESLMGAAVRAVDGLVGSDVVEDARALAALCALRAPGLRLFHTLEQMQRDGSPLMQGAATALLITLEPPEQEAGLRSARVELGPLLSSWIEGTPDATMLGRWKGLLALASPLLQAQPEAIGQIAGSVAGLDDEGFLRRVPTLREAFEVLSTAERARFLKAFGVTNHNLALEATQLASLSMSDLAARRAVDDWGLLPPEEEPEEDPPEAERPACSGDIGLEDRLRLLLGQRVPPGGKASRAARALDELYGHGHGEGSGVPMGGQGGGHEEPSLSAWEWGDELAQLFGEPVRQEVLGRAAARGRGAALLALDPNSVRPSVELLEQALSLVGGLSESQMATLRPMVKRVVDELVKELATRLQPALTGLGTPRPSRRRTPTVDLARTVRANLHTAHHDEEGRWRLAPERLLYRSRARRSLDWRIVLVVDVSGSMEPSVIYSALMAAILSGLPAVSVHFVTFSTQVIDFSERASDPLALLLEVKVGGGTHIAPALAYARGLLTVPSRSLVILVSDFEDAGNPDDLLAEVRALAESGARPLGLAALDDAGKPRYCEATAAGVVDAGMPVAALTPLELARWVGEQIR